MEDSIPQKLILYVGRCPIKINDGHLVDVDYISPIYIRPLIKNLKQKVKWKNPEWFEQYDFDEWVRSKFIIRVIDGPDDHPNIFATQSYAIFICKINDATFSVQVNSGYVYIIRYMTSQPFNHWSKETAAIKLNSNY